LVDEAGKEIKAILSHPGCHSRLYLIAYILLLSIVGLWPFNFREKNNVVIKPAGGLEIARHGTAYTALPAGKLQDLKQFAILVDLTTTSDGLDSLGKIFGYLISQEAENFFLAQWKDGMEFRVRTERNSGGMIFGADGVLEKETRTTCLIIYDGQKMHFYKNGALIRRDNRGPLSFSNWDRTYPLVIGTDATGRSQWKGRLYHIAVWDKALSPEAVADYTRQAIEGGRGADSRQSTVDSQKKRSQQQTTKQENPPVSPFVKGGESDGRPLIHYVFKTENTYEPTFRGGKALGVRDLGKGEAADLVIPEHFTPYQRVYLGWDPDWMKNRTDWLDAVVNILGFLPFGLLLVFSLCKTVSQGPLSHKPQATSHKAGKGTRGEGAGTSAAMRQDSRQPTDDSRRSAVTRQENPPVSPFAKGGGLEGGPFAKGGGIVVAVVLAVVVGFGVSLAIELLQAYLPSRDSSLRDLITNTAGTLFGALAAVWYSRKRATATSA